MRLKTLWYTLDENDNPVPCPDIMKVEGLLGDIEKRRVARDEITSDIFVSTVFLALDHNHMPDGDPVLWETMIFGGKYDQSQWRATSKKEALEHHKEAVELAKSGVKIRKLFWKN